MLEDSAINFLHGCWNYWLIKTDIDVMMLFKFDIKYVKLNFKAITSMEFNFDLKLNLLCSYDGCLFMKNRWKLLSKNYGKFSFTSFNWLRIPFDWSNVPFLLIKQELRIDWVNLRVCVEFIKISTDWEFLLIDRICLFDRSNRNRELIESSIESTWEFVLNLLKFRLIENSFRLIEFTFSIDRIGIENRSSHLDFLLKFSSWFRLIESCEFWIFTKCFHI